MQSSLVVVVSSVSSVVIIARSLAGEEEEEKTTSLFPRSLKELVSVTLNERASLFKNETSLSSPSPSTRAKQSEEGEGGISTSNAGIRFVARDQWFD
jgi:hypothetical protein